MRFVTALSYTFYFTSISFQREYPAMETLIETDSLIFDILLPSDKPTGGEEMELVDLDTLCDEVLQGSIYSVTPVASNEDYNVNRSTVVQHNSVEQQNVAQSTVAEKRPKTTKVRQCQYCESSFGTSSELLRHVRYRHTHEKRHRCTQCDYASVELSKLQRHMRSHTGEKPYQCPNCTYAAADRFKLKRHFRIHTGEKPYECDICHSRFTQSNSLKEHKLIHGSNKPMQQCNLCSYTSPSSRLMQMHMLTHNDEKPHQCDQCEQRFRQKQLLRRHQNMYHNPHYERPTPVVEGHACSYCPKVFRHPGNLVRHLALHDNAQKKGSSGTASPQLTNENISMQVEVIQNLSLLQTCESNIEVFVV